MKAAFNPFVLAAVVLAALIVPSKAQDTSLFGTAGNLQDGDSLQLPEPASYQALTSPEDAADLCLADVANQYGHSSARASKT